MRKLLLWFIALSILVSFTAAQNLYQQDSLLLELAVQSGFTLTATSSSATLQEVSADLLLFPQEEFRQKMTTINTIGTLKDGLLAFSWNDRQIGKKNYGYTVLIKTTNEQLEVRQKIIYPLAEQQVQGLQEYLKPTPSIDSDNPKVIAKAAELTEGEDDLFKVAFKLASWVEENVNYDLNTLTETASLPASWVLEHRQGVCDEMTSLFVAMARAMGIPARFVSGISYTTSPLFSEHWQPHGWAEVYFPEIGWVSFDITFGEYGYVDVTHIKLQDSFDPGQPATTFQWLANDVQLKAEPLRFEVNVVKEGSFVPEAIQLEQEILDHEVGAGSYNLVKGILKNRESRYAATTLSLAVPKEVEILGRNKRTILLSPKEVRETYWIVKVPDSVAENYIYTFPSIIFSEKNISATDSFTVTKGETTYDQEEIEKLTIVDEEKTYSRKIIFDCLYPRELELGQTDSVRCVIKNQGTINLKDVLFCLGEICETFDLPLNQQEHSEITIQGDKAGLKKLVITAENQEVEKKSVIEYTVLDPPLIKTSTVAPASLIYGQALSMKIILEKSSFTNPRNVTVLIEGPGFSNSWDVNEVARKVELPLQIGDLPLQKKNVFTLSVTWQDQKGKTFSSEQEVMIAGEAESWGDSLKMMLNGILNWFY